jgi:hypothetical protein
MLTTLVCGSQSCTGTQQQPRDEAAPGKRLSVAVRMAQRVRLFRRHAARADAEGGTHEETFLLMQRGGLTGASGGLLQILNDNGS